MQITVSISHSKTHNHRGWRERTGWGDEKQPVIELMKLSKIIKRLQWLTVMFDYKISISLFPLQIVFVPVLLLPLHAHTHTNIGSQWGILRWNEEKKELKRGSLGYIIGVTDDYTPGRRRAGRNSADDGYHRQLSRAVCRPSCRQVHYTRLLTQVGSYEEREREDILIPQFHARLLFFF